MGRPLAVSGKFHCEAGLVQSADTINLSGVVE